MKYLPTLLLCFLFLSTYAQKEIKLEELKDHIGDSVKVQGIISGVKYLESAKNTPTFISVGAAYPNQLLTIVIWGDVRQNMTLLPSSKDVGNKIVVAGKVELFKDKPQIVIKDPRQLEIVQDAQGELQ
ncbi:MAG: hypothetical protein ACXVBX_15040 [Flavisolibacter sp.]